MAKVRLPNLTNTLVLTGTVLLVIGVTVPGHTADRAARVETRAEEAARALLGLALEAEPIDLSAADAAADLETRFRAACRETGHPDSYLPTARHREGRLVDVPCALFDSKHYCFMLTRRPAPSTQEHPTRQPFEVYAWPQTLTPPGHTAFFIPEVGAPAFTRNMMHQYVGWTELRRRKRTQPRPGAAVPRNPVEHRAYRGADDERWILLRSAE